MDIKSEFNKIAQDYDKQRPQFIPCFYDFYGMAIENLEFNIEQPSILDVGAGTGLFSDFVLQKYPNAKITLVDISEKMLKMAKERFSNNDNIELINTDINKFVCNTKYDAVISSLAIHHLENSEKIDIYNKIYTFLKENGLFLHAEQVEGETPYMRNLNQTRWENSVEISGLSRKEIDAGYLRTKLDIRVPLSQQIKWLKNSGFAEVDCIYKYYDFTVIYCKK